MAINIVRVISHYDYAIDFTDWTAGAELVEGPEDDSDFEAMPTVGRAVYNFGALLTITGVGSVE